MRWHGSVATGFSHATRLSGSEDAGQLCNLKSRIEHIVNQLVVLIDREHAEQRVRLTILHLRIMSQRMPQAPRSTPPWTNSQALGGYFIYVPSTDEIYLGNGRHFPRPTNIPRNSPAIAVATYNGTLPPPVLPQHPLPITGSPPTAMQMPMHPGSPQNLVGAMGSMNLNRGPTQQLTGRNPVEVVFHQGGTQSQIQRKDPPNLRTRGVNIDKPELTSTLFKAYKVRTNPKQFFRIGKVFLVLWSEPAGGTSLVSKWATGTVINHLGERVFSKVRRFVVVREGGNYCNALPINTYLGRGVAKPGVNKSEHVIIFTGKTPPLPTARELPGQGQLGMRHMPIQVDPDTLDETLDPMSRLDLGGVTKVEHNIKVKPLGNVNKRSLGALREQYANVQNHQAGVGAQATPAQYALHPNTQSAPTESDEEESEEDEGDEEEGAEDDEDADDGNENESEDDADDTNRR